MRCPGRSGASRRGLPPTGASGRSAVGLRAPGPGCRLAADVFLGDAGWTVRGDTLVAQTRASKKSGLPSGGHRTARLRSSRWDGPAPWSPLQAGVPPAPAGPDPLPSAPLKEPGVGPGLAKGLPGRGPEMRRHGSPTGPPHSEGFTGSDTDLEPLQPAPTSVLAGHPGAGWPGRGGAGRGTNGRQGKEAVGTGPSPLPPSPAESEAHSGPRPLRGPREPPPQ